MNILDLFFIFQVIKRVYILYLSFHALNYLIITILFFSLFNLIIQLHYK